MSSSARSGSCTSTLPDFSEEAEKAADASERIDFVSWCDIRRPVRRSAPSGGGGSNGDVCSSLALVGLTSRICCSAASSSFIRASSSSRGIIGPPTWVVDVVVPVRRVDAVPAARAAAAGTLTSVSVPVCVCVISFAPLRRERLRNGSVSSPLSRGVPSPGLCGRAGLAGGRSSKSSGLTICHSVQIGVCRRDLRREKTVVERFQKLELSLFAGGSAAVRVRRRWRRSSSQMRISRTRISVPRIAPSTAPITVADRVLCELVAAADDVADADVDEVMEDIVEVEAVVEALVMEEVVDEDEEDVDEEVEDVEVVEGGGVSPPYVQSEFRGIYWATSVAVTRWGVNIQIRSLVPGSTLTGR